jgi:ABC-2 type transport system permease protein
MGSGKQVLSMPLFFAGNAIYPTIIMPDRLKTISHFNPLPHVVDALRIFMLAGSTSSFGVSHECAAIPATTTVLIFSGARR